MILAYISSVKRKQKVNPYGLRQHASVVLQKREILPHQYSYVEESSSSRKSQERSWNERKDGPEYLTCVNPPARSNQTLRLQTARSPPVEKTWLQICDL